ncbi:leucine-rich repeat protein kinase family protein [Actinidia rufa]|uniref:Leucine-rich repeat protein kinase family protein n=1 Tax=Actinidia rufa TaxID=165716 RepID=A0A7J0DYQ0_9ERIC|nr:leucine-rich repeat protein kinase family protein [Actinidia rufa]
MNVCNTFKSIRHRNLVKVLTACSSSDHNGNDFNALVYEFMANGSLGRWLHSNENENGEFEDSRNLSLLERLNIAIDVACTLDYLHHYSPELIVHCDLKPSNILLDNELTGHGGDFGIARFLLKVSYKSGNESSSISIKGSIGYAAPEMFTGKSSIDNMFSDSLSLHKFAKVALPKQVASIANPTIFHVTYIRPTHPPTTSIAVYDLRDRCQHLKSATLHNLMEHFSP